MARDRGTGCHAARINPGPGSRLRRHPWSRGPSGPNRNRRIGPWRGRRARSDIRDRRRRAGARRRGRPGRPAGTLRPRPPRTSGRQVASAASTGQPTAIASQSCKPEPLVKARVGEAGRLGVERGEVGVLDVAQQAEPALGAERPGQFDQAGPLVVAAAGQDEVGVDPGGGEPADQERDVLPPLPAADVEGIRPIGPDQGAGPDAVGRGDRGGEDRVGGLGDDDDLPPGDLQASHQVAAGVPAHGDHPMGPRPGLPVAEAVEDRARVPGVPAGAWPGRNRPGRSRRAGSGRGRIGSTTAVRSWPGRAARPRRRGRIAGAARTAPRSGIAAAARRGRRRTRPAADRGRPGGSAGRRRGRARRRPRAGGPAG